MYKTWNPAGFNADYRPYWNHPLITPDARE
jgi:hypothetical protein